MPTHICTDRETLASLSFSYKNKYTLKEKVYFHRKFQYTGEPRSNYRRERPAFVQHLHHASGPVKTNVRYVIKGILCGVSEPGVPGGIHAAQIVQAVCCSHQGVDLTLSSLELSQVMEAGHDGGDGLLDQ